MRHRLLTSALVCLVLVTGSGAFTAATQDTAQEAGARLSQTGAALDAAGRPGTTPQDLADAITLHEDALAAMRAIVIQAGARENALRLGLARDATGIANLLATLERVSIARSRPVGLHPMGPVAGERSRMMAQALEPELRARAEAISARYASVRDAGETQRGGLETLQEGLARLASARETLAARMQAERGEPQEGAEQPVAVSLEEADTLGDLTKSLSRDTTPRDPDFVPATLYDWPVASNILRGFNDKDSAGVSWPGIVLDAPPLSLVRAPSAGLIRYAGPFLDYRGVVVMETPEGAQLMLAGLAELNVDKGQRVMRGEPLGMLGGRSPGVEEYVMLQDGQTGAGLREALYIEIRYGRSPVDPVAWFDGIR